MGIDGMVIVRGNVQHCIFMQPSHCPVKLRVNTLSHVGPSVLIQDIGIGSIPQSIFISRGLRIDSVWQRRAIALSHINRGS